MFFFNYIKVAHVSSEVMKELDVKKKSRISAKNVEKKTKLYM